MARPVTLQEFERLPEMDGIQELMDGAVIQMPPRKRRQSELCSNVVRVLARHVDESRIWVGTGFVIGPHCLQPDVAVIDAAQQTERGWFAGAPVIAIEIASRGNIPDELERKKDLYLAHGAREVWIVYDKTRTIAVHDGKGSVSHHDHFDSAALQAHIAVAEVFV